MRDPIQAMRSGARDVARWVPPAARLGYAAKGVVYLMIGWIALRAATAAGEVQGATGALASLRDETGGRQMLTAIAIGLACHVLWRAVQALLDPEHPSGHDVGKRLGMRVFYAISAVVYASLALTAWQLAHGGNTGESGESQVWISELLRKPAGTWLVMGAGLGVIGYGMHQLYKAWRGDVNRHLAPHTERARRTLKALGRFGTAARGLVLLPIGWFVFNAGRLYRSEAAVDTEEVLKMLGSGWLLALVGLGLAAYGAHQVGKALYRRIAAPTPPG